MVHVCSFLQEESRDRETNLLETLCKRNYNTYWFGASALFTLLLHWRRKQGERGTLSLQKFKQNHILSVLISATSYNPTMPLSPHAPPPTSAATGSIGRSDAISYGTKSNLEGRIIMNYCYYCNNKNFERHLLPKIMKSESLNSPTFQYACLTKAS